MGRGWVGENILVIGAECHVVDVEKEYITGIWAGCYSEILGYRGIASRLVVIVWCRQGKIILVPISGLAG